MGRQRSVKIGGVQRQLAAKHALRFEVVRGVLTGEMRLDAGAAKLRMHMDDLAALVAGARQAVIRALGEGVLEAAERSSTLSAAGV